MIKLFSSEKILFWKNIEKHSSHTPELLFNAFLILFSKTFCWRFLFFVDKYFLILLPYIQLKYTQNVLNIENYFYVNYFYNKNLQRKQKLLPKCFFCFNKYLANLPFLIQITNFVPKMPFLKKVKNVKYVWKVYLKMISKRYSLNC